MPFHVHDIYVMKSLNCVCVFYVRIETKIQYGHKELEQFNKIETTIKENHEELNWMRNWNKSIWWWEIVKHRKKFGYKLDQTLGIIMHAQASQLMFDKNNVDIRVQTLLKGLKASR
jgi:hypothetical protein